MCSLINGSCQNAFNKIVIIVYCITQFVLLILFVKIYCNRKILGAVIVFKPYYFINYLL